MNIELKRIAQKKLEQMGATVHGVLVKNEAGAWAAVSEAGRVMWLDDFEAEAEPAQGGQGAEPVADFRADIRTGRDICDEYSSYLALTSDGKSEPYMFIPENLDDAVLDEAMRRLNYTHPQPAQQGVSEWMAEISSNLKTQDNRITADPLFVVFQKREIVVAEDYDHDRIAWVGDEGQEPGAETAETLDDLRDDVDSDWWAEDEITLTDDDDGEMEWRRLALKTVDEFVTACFTEAGAKDYLKVNGHNLRLPHIYVTSLYRNEEMKQLRDWLLAAAPQPPQEGE